MIERLEVERFRLVSSRPFGVILAAINARIAHPNVAELFHSIQQADSIGEMEKLIQEAVGPLGLMLFFHFDHGAVVNKGVQNAPQIIRLLIGNPLIMASMAQHIPDAASYAPVTVLIDERKDGVYLSYDRMASVLAPHGNSEVLSIAHDLDTKIEQLLQQAAS